MAVDFKQLDSISAVKHAKDGTDYVFTDGEKDLFENVLVKTVEDAREVAEWLVKIKEANSKNQKNDKLINDLEDEKDKGIQGSKVYQILNRGGLIRRTIDRLSFLGRSDLPTDKDKINEKITELEKEVAEKRAERALNNTPLDSIERELKGLTAEREEAKKRLKRREDVIAILEGTYTGLNVSVTASHGIHDYSRTGDSDSSDNLLNASPPNIVGTTITVGSTTITVNNFQDVLDVANLYLDEIRNTYPGTPNIYRQNRMGGLYDSRSFQNWQRFNEGWDQVGYSFLRCLRQITSKKLDKIIDRATSVDSERTRLKKIAKRLEECIHWHEEISGKKGYTYFLASDDSAGWTSKYDNWQRNLPNKKLSEYPYIPAVDRQGIIDLVTTIFPMENPGVFVDDDTSLRKVDYLFKVDDPDFIKKPSSSKGWSEIFYIGGYAERPTDGVSIGAWAESGASNPSLIKQQIEEVENVPVSLDFSSIVEIWYRAMAAFYDFENGVWLTNDRDLYEEEIELANARNELRYIKTMREFFHALGLGAKEEFDEVLTNIADLTEKSRSAGDIAGTYRLFSEVQKLTSGKTKDFKFTAADFWKDAGKYWNENYSKSPVEALKGQLDRYKDDALFYQTKIDAVQSYYNTIMGKDYELGFEINRRKRQIADLKTLLDFKEKTLPEQINIFNELYKKKDTQGGKWLVADIKLMEAYLKSVKEEYEKINESDKYESEGFKAKSEELTKIMNGFTNDDGDFVDGVNQIHGTIKTDLDMVIVSEKTIAAAIKKILKLLEEKKGTTTLEDINGHFAKLDDLVLLDDQEKNHWEEIKKAIKDPSKYKDKPVSDLSKDKLNALFGTTLATDSEIKLTDWKDHGKAGKYNQESEIKELVKNYKPGATEASGLKEHLKHESWGDVTKWGGKKFEGDKWWDDLIKEGPAFVIGAIKHFEWENKKGDYDTDDKKNKVTKEMGDMNEKEGEAEGDKKIKIDQKWDTNKASHIAQFLYRKAIGQSGNKLIKSYTLVDKDKKPEDSKNEKGHFAKWWPLYAGLGVLLVVGIGAVIYFWDNIRSWWSPSEGVDSENE